MIIIPPLKTVVILVPRTGSGSLYRAVLKRWPTAMMPYRHMEADGVPAGYDRWNKVGVVRHPVSRLWSLYNYLLKILRDPVRTSHKYQEDVLSRMSRNLAGFEDYILNNEMVFPLTYRSVAGDPGSFDPFYWSKHSVPENRKSQFEYLRPDLGTEVFSYETQLPALYKFLDVEPGRENVSESGDAPALSETALDYLYQVFGWEFSLGYRMFDQRELNRV